MVIVLIYWIYLFISTITLGIAFTRLLKIKKINPILLPLYGGFAIAIIAGLWAIFNGLGQTFELTLGILTVLLLLAQRNALGKYLFLLKAKVFALPLFSKIILGTVFIFALAQCASAPYVIDNESYYIQTIKWLDTYGFVPGLANFHYFLGQQSGWHILTSALNLNSLSGVLNDINGFYLLLGNLYALDALNRYRSSGRSMLLAMGLFPIFNVFFFQFISSPSPDLPIYIITYILFSEFTSYYTKQEPEQTPLVLLFVLVVFAVYIKVIAIFLLPFPILLYIKNKSLFKKELKALAILSFLALFVFVVKNSIISGHPLYPLAFFKQDFDWTVPTALQQYLVEATKSYAFFITPEQYEQMSLVQRLVYWVSLPKLHGLFNKGMLLILVIFPIVSRKKLRTAPFITLYTVSLCLLIFLWLSSPQYRFFFGYFMLLLFVTIAPFLKRDILIKIALGASTVAIAIPLFVPLRITQLTNNEFKQELSTFSINYALMPHPITKYVDATYKTITVGNLKYNTPTNIDFFWATGDCALPCIQDEQLQGFKNYFEQAPQLRTQELKDGFKSVYFKYE